MQSRWCDPSGIMYSTVFYINVQCNVLIIKIEALLFNDRWTAFILICWCLLVRSDGVCVEQPKLVTRDPSIVPGSVSIAGNGKQASSYASKTVQLHSVTHELKDSDLEVTYDQTSKPILENTVSRPWKHQTTVHPATNLTTFKFLNSKKKAWYFWKSIISASENPWFYYYRC
jgi:hypothetical protein